MSKKNIRPAYERDKDLKEVETNINDTKNIQDQPTQEELNQKIQEALKDIPKNPKIIHESVPPEILKNVPKVGISPKKFFNKKKVAIVGFAESWRKTPFNDESFEIWGINELYAALNKAKVEGRFTRWFEIHDPKSPSKNNEEHLTFLKTCPLPLYMQKKFKEFPNSIAYPRNEVKEMVNNNMIINEIGGAYTDFSNQITWMILMAIHEGFEEIHVYGVDMAQESEYAWQRASCQFSIGFALGKGIKILIPNTSELCHGASDYGFESDNQKRHYKKRRKSELRDQQKALVNEIRKRQMKANIIKEEIAELTAGIQQCEGAIKEVKHDLSNNIV